MTEYYHLENGILNAYTGREEEITVPEGIHTIGESAFKGCVSLKKVVLPAGLKCIMGDAFKGCRKLEEVIIPDGVSYIGRYAFHRCHELKRAILPRSVEELGECAFLYCDSMTQVRIPGVKRLGNQAFANGISLEKLEISREMDERCICDVFTGCGRVTEISFADGEVFHMPNVVEVAAGGLQAPPLVELIVKDILRMMELDGRCLVRFRVNIKHVEVPEGIEILAKSCFYDMRGILDVKLPKSLKLIESRAFRNCISLEKVIFGGEQVQIHGDAFRNCTSLKSVRTGDGKEYAFSGLSDIYSLGSEEGFSGIAGQKVMEYKETDTESAWHVPELVRKIRKQVLGNFRISGTMLLQYLGAESRVVVPEGITMIAEEAFAGNETIDKIILPDSLREIGAEAFRGCLLLQSIVLPEGLYGIGPGAFDHCVKLLRIGIPSRVSKLEDRVFRHCQVLQEVSFPEGFQSIGESTFYGCGGLKKVLLPESLVSIGKMAFYRSGLKEVRIPAKTEYVQGLAFAKSDLRKVWISGGAETGKHYGEDVFGDCARLKVLVLEEGVRHIPDKLAYGCVALERVILPDTLESAGRLALEGTAFLAGGRSMQTARSLTEQEDALCSNENGTILWDGRDLEGKVRISKDVRIVAGGAFYGNEKVTEVYIPEQVESVGAAAFKGCKMLRRVYLPSSINRLPAEVFSGCTELEEVLISTFAQEDNAYGEAGKAAVSAGVGESEEGEPAYGEGGKAAVSAGAGDAVGENMLPVWKSVGERTFYRCGKLRRLRLERAELIGKEALAGCSALEGSAVNAGLQAGEQAFAGTQFEEKQENGLRIVGNLVVSGEDCQGEITLPEGIRGIAPYAFAGNRRISGVIMPGELQWIGEGAFYGCSGLQAAVFPEKLQRVGAHAFEKCISLRKVESAVRQAGKAAFAGCISLVSARLPQVSILWDRLFAGCVRLEECYCESAKAVMPFCFSNCKSLRDFDFHHLFVVREYAFAGCESLKYAEFRDSACLGRHALEDCSGLERISLSGEICLKEYALSGCTSLRQVVYQEREWYFGCYGDILSEQIPETVRLLFHSAFSCFAVEQEENLSGYRGAARVVRIPEGIRRIEAEVFRDAMMLEQAEIPESVEYIGARAFHGTAWMERKRRESPLVVVKDMLLDGSGCVGDVTVPADIRLVCGWAFANGLKIECIRFLAERVRVEEYAFRNCINLREMVLPDGAVVNFTGLEDREKELPPLAKQAVTDSLNCFKTDGKGVLTECTGNISELRLAHGITEIGEGAFQDGNLLTEITFPETVTKIGKRAFAGCKWLSGVRNADGVEDIGELAFSGCGALRHVELSEKLRQLGARAFENCTSLEEIWIPEGVEEIPERAFYRCHNLKHIVLPSTLKRIGREAFAFCGMLYGILVPESVLVEERAFIGTAQAL